MTVPPPAKSQPRGHARGAISLTGPASASCSPPRMPWSESARLITVLAVISGLAVCTVLVGARSFVAIAERAPSDHRCSGSPGQRLPQPPGTGPARIQPVVRRHMLPPALRRQRQTRKFPQSPVTAHHRADRLEHGIGPPR